MSDGTICPDELYRKDELLRRAGLKEAAWRTCRRHGLRVMQANGRSYVLGRDFIEYVSQLARRSDPKCDMAEQASA